MQGHAGGAGPVAMDAPPGEQRRWRQGKKHHQCECRHTLPPVAFEGGVSPSSARSPQPVGPLLGFHIAAAGRLCRRAIYVWAVAARFTRCEIPFAVDVEESAAAEWKIRRAVLPARHKVRSWCFLVLPTGPAAGVVPCRRA